MNIPDSLRNYKPKSVYSSARNQVIDMIIKKGYQRHEAEALLNALWKLHDRNPSKVAAAIVNL